MKTLKRIRYYTMNSWNLSTAPAYNLKIYNVIDRSLQDRVYELMEAEGFYDSGNELIAEFDRENDYRYQAGFNGRSGGYLVLYQGGKKLSEHKSYCTSCGQRNFTSIKETGKKCGKCNKNSRIDREFYETYTKPGMGIEDEEVPKDVLKRFDKLAHNIVKETEYMAKHFKAEEETYTVEKTRKIIKEA